MENQQCTKIVRNRGNRNNEDTNNQVATDKVAESS